MSGTYGKQHLFLRDDGLLESDETKAVLDIIRPYSEEAGCRSAGCRAATLDSLMGLEK